MGDLTQVDIVNGAAIISSTVGRKNGIAHDERARALDGPTVAGRGVGRKGTTVDIQHRAVSKNAAALSTPVSSRACEIVLDHAIAEVQRTVIFDTAAEVRHAAISNRQTTDTGDNIADAEYPARVVAANGQERSVRIENSEAFADSKFTTSQSDRPGDSGSEQNGIADVCVA